jgi:two-component system response regulator AtoC
LIVDEDELLADLLREVLDDAGFLVFTVSSALDALEAETRNELDLILTDLNLRNSSGFELLERLAERSVAPPAVLMTAYLDNETETRARQLGARATLGKPFSNDQVLSVVRHVLASHAVHPIARRSPIS